MSGIDKQGEDRIKALRDAGTFPSSAGGDARQQHEGLHGFLVIDKPVGISSARAVAVVKRATGGARTGHGGTLDPLATGVLVMGIGSATRMLERVMAAEKRYETRIDLTAFTTTDDLEGEATSVQCDAIPTEAMVRAAVETFRGQTMQTPPTYSAVKIGGRRAYDLARKGHDVPVQPRPVVVHQIETVRYEWPTVDVAIRCGKGFYVRSFARMLGQALGTGGHCMSIRRVAIGPFHVDRSTLLDGLPDSLRQEHLISAAEATAMVEQWKANERADDASQAER